MIFRKKIATLIGASALISMTAFASGKEVSSAANMLDRTVAPWAEMGGASLLTRSKTKIKLNGYTTGLEPNNAYSIWWVIYNKPERCVDGSGEYYEIGCGKDEIIDPDLAKDVQSSMLWASGFISDSNGNASFSAELKRGNPLGEVVMGPGLLKPKKAEVHFLIRSHGDLKVGMVKDQISTMNANCMPEGDHVCENIQGGVHKLSTHSDMDMP